MTANRSAKDLNESRLIDAGLVLRTEVQAAAFLGVSPRALQKWRVSGRGPPFLRLSSRCIRYCHADLIGWAETHMFRSTAEYAAARPRVRRM